MDEFKTNGEERPVRIYEGNYGEQMARLRSDGCEPIGVADLMKLRIWALQQPSEVKSALWDQNIYCGADSMAREKSGKLKIHPNSSRMRNYPFDKAYLTLIITPEQYTSIKGPEFSAIQVKHYTQRRADTPATVMTNGILIALVPERKLLRAYADAACALNKSYYTQNMKVLVPAPAEDIIEQPWRLGSIANRSELSCIHKPTDIGILLGKLVHEPTRVSSAPRAYAPEPHREDAHEPLPADAILQ